MLRASESQGLSVNIVQCYRVQTLESEGVGSDSTFYIYMLCDLGQVT